MQNVLSSMPFPASKKVYVEGSRPDIRVPMREITLSPTKTEAGESKNDPICVYDTSGPYTDTEFQADIYRGLPELRKRWILERDDVEEYEGQPVCPEDNGLSKGKESNVYLPY
jgi:phosphomethylpyrimidine synthase